MKKSSLNVFLSTKGEEFVAIKILSHINKYSRYNDEKIFLPSQEQPIFQRTSNSRHALSGKSIMPLKKPLV